MSVCAFLIARHCALSSRLYCIIAFIFCFAQLANKFTWLTYLFPWRLGSIWRDTDCKAWLALCIAHLFYYAGHWLTCDLCCCHVWHSRAAGGRGGDAGAADWLIDRTPSTHSPSCLIHVIRFNALVTRFGGRLDWKPVAWSTRWRRWRKADPGQAPIQFVRRASGAIQGGISSDLARRCIIRALSC